MTLSEDQFRTHFTGSERKATLNYNPVIRSFHYCIQEHLRGFLPEDPSILYTKTYVETELAAELATLEPNKYGSLTLRALDLLFLTTTENYELLYHYLSSLGSISTDLIWFLVTSAIVGPIPKGSYQEVKTAINTTMAIARQSRSNTRAQFEQWIRLLQASKELSPLLTRSSSTKTSLVGTTQGSQSHHLRLTRVTVTIIATLTEDQTGTILVLLIGTSLVTSTESPWAARCSLCNHKGGKNAGEKTHKKAKKKKKPRDKKAAACFFFIIRHLQSSFCSHQYWCINRLQSTANALFSSFFHTVVYFLFCCVAGTFFSL